MNKIEIPIISLYFQFPKASAMFQIITLHDKIFYYIIIIFILIFLLLAFIVFFFNNTKIFLIKNFSYATQIEIIWTIIPMGILFSIILPSFNLLYAQDELINPENSFKILGFQWYWTYQYKHPLESGPLNDKFVEYSLIDTKIHESFDAILNTNAVFYSRLMDTFYTLNLEPYSGSRLIITSNDVIHSWAVPSLGIKVDAIPGRLNQISTEIMEEGFYIGQCSEICGANHGFMPIIVHATLNQKNYG